MSFVNEKNVKIEKKQKRIFAVVIKMIDYEKLNAFFPQKIKKALLKIFESTREEPTEIHIVKGSASAVFYLRRRVYLGIFVGEAEMAEILSLLTGGALYAHVHTIKNGYVSLGGGVRVGICGQARYEKGELVGISDVTSYLIRLPSHDCSFKDELLEAFRETKRGMLIFAPSCGGKTTALRALVSALANSTDKPRISVIDERCEFNAEDLLSLDVDVFRGYKRGDGVEIAIRVMSPQIIAIDEIGSSQESGELAEWVFGGGRFIATAHAKSLADLKKRKNLAALLSLGIFDTFVRIFDTGADFSCEILKEDAK